MTIPNSNLDELSLYFDISNEILALKEMPII